MLIDTELEPITIELGLAAWREVLVELRNIPELRGAILNQLLEIVGPEYRGELTDQGMHHAILARPGASRGRGKRRSDANVEEVN